MLRKERYNNILCKDLLKVTQFASEQMRHLVFTNQNIWAQTSWTKEKYAEEKLVGRREAYYNKYQCKLPNQWRTQCVKSRDELKSIIYFPLRYHLYNTGDRFLSVRVIDSKKYL